MSPSRSPRCGGRANPQTWGGEVRQPVNKAKRTPLDEAVLREHHPTAECIVKSPRYNPEIDAGPEPEPNVVEEEEVVDGEGAAGADGTGSQAAAGTASSAAAASDAAAATTAASGAAAGTTAP